MRYVALASDYDGTLASSGTVHSQTLHGIDRLQKSGRKLILVTGRELNDLKSVFPQIGCCALVVAENGGLLKLCEAKSDRRQPLVAGIRSFSLTD